MWFFFSSRKQKAEIFQKFSTKFFLQLIKKKLPLKKKICPRSEINEEDSMKFMKKLDEKYRKGRKNLKSLIEFFEILAPKCDEIFFACRTPGATFEINSEFFPSCCSRFKRFLTGVGTCFTIENRNDTIPKQKVAGPIGGLTLIFRYQESNWVPVMLNNPFEHALRIYNDPVDAILEQNAVMVPVGQRIRISVTKTTMIRKNEFCIQ